MAKTTKKASKKATAKKAASTSTSKKKTSKKSSTPKTNKVGLPTKKSPKQAKEATNELETAMQQVPQDQQAKLQEIKTVVEKFKEKIMFRLEGYVMGVALLPPSKDEQGEENKEQINVLTLIDDSDSTKMSKEELQEKVQKLANDLAQDIDKNLQPQTLILSELWQQCYDQKPEILQAIAMSAIIYDTGMLAAVKLAEVHKNLVLKKFEKYIVSYGLAGSLAQGLAKPESDIDVFVVIDDTDVKKMTRVELRDKLRAIIIQMGHEASQMTGIKKDFNIQVYILTDFWESIKDASPVIFTFLRDGIPFYDRGVFMPWKQLLQMGRIKPSPEAIEMYLGSGRQFIDKIEAKFKQIAMEDFYWGLITPAQAAIMMAGIPPTTPKETAKVMQEVFVEKEKILEAKYVKTLEKVYKIHKDIEHGKKTKVSGAEIDKLVVEGKAFLDRLEKLFRTIEENKEKETVLHMYENIITIIRDALRLEGIDKVDEKNLEFMFKEHIITKGYLAQRYLRHFKDLLKAKKDFDQGKLTKQEVNTINKDSKEFTKALVEHIQRKRGQEIEKTRIKVKYGKDSYGEVILLEDHAYIIEDMNKEDKRNVSRAKMTPDGMLHKREEIDWEEFESALMKAELPGNAFIKHRIFEDIKDIFGEDVEILVNK